MYATRIRIFLLQLLLIASISSNAQAPTFQWAKQMGSITWDKGISLELDDNGSVISTGVFYDTTDFDPGAGTLNLVAEGNQDVYISKLDANGNLIWAKQFGGTGWKECHGMVTDKQSNIYITGYFLGIADFDPGPTTYIHLASGAIDAFICKLDSSGNFIWAKQLEGTLAIEAFAIAVDDSGNVYTTGYFDGTADLDPSTDTASFTVLGYSDIFVLKLDPSGNYIWARQMSGSDGELGHAIAVDAAGNIYTTGTFFGSVDFDPGPATFFLSSPGAQKIFLSKLDPSGNFAWAKNLGGETGYALALDAIGNVHVTGYYGWSDISISKIDPAGNITWSKEFGAFTARSLDVDQNGNVYSTGQFYGTGDFDPGPSTFNMTSFGSTDSYINKLDSSGNFIWAMQVGGSNEVHSRSLKVDESNAIYTTGYFNYSADFDPGPSVSNLTAISSFDIFIHKLAPVISSIPENDSAADFKIYPVPSNGIFYLEFEQVQMNANLVVRNILGQVVGTKSISSSRLVELEIDGADGVYLLEVTDQKQHHSVVRIIKN